MFRPGIAIALLSACSFSHGVLGAQQDAAPDTSQLPPDAAIDAPVTPPVDAPPDAPPMPTDTDGDGVADTVDNCPSIANTNQRDHDGDARGDACDKCPHLASASDPDGDGDGVGDACDPRAMMGGDSIALFEGFYDASSIASWTVNGGTWSVANGVLTQSSTAATDVSLVAPVTVTRAAVTSSARVLAFGTPSEGNPFTLPHVSVTSGVASGQGYWCSVVDDDNDDRIYASTDWNGVLPDYPSATWPGTFAVNSEVRMTTALIGSNNICTVVQGTTTATASGSIGPSSGAAQVATRTASASFDYLFVVAIGN